LIADNIKSIQKTDKPYVSFAFNIYEGSDETLSLGKVSFKARTTTAVHTTS
jgi:hypothetical protein